MSRGAGVVFLWAAWLTALAALLSAWTPGDWVQWSPLVAAAAGAWVVGLALRLRSRPGEERLVPDYSPPTVLLVLGLAAAAAAPSFGFWLLLVGAGIAAGGALGLIREALAARRSAR